jgi:hypothetical protein
MPATLEDTLQKFKAWVVWKRINAEAGMNKEELEVIEDVERLLDRYEAEQLTFKQ